MITVHNIKLNVIVKGEGQAMVLLHGWGQNSYMMKFIQDYFCKTYKVINMDLPGFGESEEPHEVWSVEDYAYYLYEFLTSMGIEKPILIAHSFGARIALRYASHYPVEKMILTGAAGIRPKRGLSYYIRVYTYKAMKKLHLAPTMGSEDYRNASGVMRGILVASVEDDLRDVLPQIEVETLLVWGDRDTQTPLWMGKVMENEMPHATLIVLEKDDHFAYFHQSMRFTGIVEAFLHG